MRKLLIVGATCALVASAIGVLAQVVPQPGPPTPIAGAFNTTPPTLTSGQAGWVQLDSSGNLLTSSAGTVPSSGTAVGITPVVSTAAESSHILKSGAGNLYSITITTGASAGYLLIFNATSAPVDGAVTPQQCVSVPATSTASVDYGAIPSIYSTGITAVFSTTGCFTKTASATAFFNGRVK